MHFSHSILLQTPYQTNQLDAFVAWFNQTYNTDFSLPQLLNQPNIIVLNSEGESIKIETIRNYKEQLAYTPYHAKQTQFLVLFSAEQLTIPAQNAFLKTLEEPPPQTQIILVTSYPQKLLETILSRCQHIVFESSLLSQTTNSVEYSKIETLYDQLITSNPGKRVTLAGGYKDRSEAKKLCMQFLYFFHTKLQNAVQQNTCSQYIHNLNQTLTALTYLEKNIAVGGTLEALFLELQ